MEKEAHISSSTHYILLMLWNARKFLLKIGVAGLLVGIIIIISIPKEYETSIYTVPESTIGKIDMNGVFSIETNIGGGKIQDAIRPSLYPKIVNSTPFLLSLFDIPVMPSTGKDTLTLSEYISTHQRAPWWSSIRTGISKLISLPLALFREKETDNINDLSATTAANGTSTETFHLSLREAAIAAAIRSRINVDVDKKKRTITLRIRMQDPFVSAIVADSVKAKLYTFVSNYRTGKERANLKYAENLCLQARGMYYEAQKTYAHFADANLFLSRKVYQKDLYNLQVAMNLAYKEYVRTSQQLQLAKIRLYKTRPVFAVIEPATVPLSPVSPSKVKILSGCILLFGAMGCIWVYFNKCSWVIPFLLGQNGKRLIEIRRRNGDVG